MLLSNSQISMRPLCSDLLFTPVDYIFVTCLTKCLSWIVGVQSRTCPCFCKCIIVMLCKFISESVVELWEMTWALGLKKWLKSRRCTHNTGQKSPWTHAYPCCGCVWSLLDACFPTSKERRGFNGLKTQLVSGVGYLSVWDGS